MPNQISSALKNGSIIEASLKRIDYVDGLIATASFVKAASSEEDASVILAAGILSAAVEGVDLNEESLNKIAGVVGEKGMEKLAQSFMGDAMRGTGDMLGKGADWAKGLWNKGKGAWDAAKQTGQQGMDFAKNIPQNLRQKGYDMQQQGYQKQLADLKQLYTQVSTSYKSMKMEMAMLGKMSQDVKKMIDEGRINPQSISLMQTNVAQLKQHLGSLNKLINQLGKFKNVAAPTPLNQQQQPAVPPAASPATPAAAPANHGVK